MKRTKIILNLLLSFYCINSQADTIETPLTTRVVKINLKSDVELQETLKKFMPKNNAISVFDEVGSGKVTLQVMNDYNFKNPNKGPIKERNDDIGHTHGFKVGIHKNLEGLGFDKYFLTISYETNLFTNSDRPEDFQENYFQTLYENEDGYLQADVYFKEENLITLMANKVKERDAFYWAAGGGYHEINAEDSNRGILISGVSQQRWHHRNINEMSGPTLREYNYIEQEGVSQSGVFIKGILGKDITVYKTDLNRAYLRPEVESMLTQIDEASYIGTSVEVGNDFITGRNSMIPDIRISGKYQVNKYSTGTYKEYSIGAEVQTRYFGVKFKYVLPKTEAPSYLNPLPQDFENRNNLRPPSEPTVWLQIEGKLPH
jgi:hypothetical protein